MSAAARHDDAQDEVARLRELVLDLGEQVAALTAEHGRDRAKMKRLRRQVREIDQGLVIASAGGIYNDREIKAIRLAVGLPLKSAQQEHDEHMALMGHGPQPSAGSPAAPQARREPGTAPLVPRSPYDQAAAVQARRRSMHAVPPPAGVRRTRPRRPPPSAVRQTGGSP